MQSHQSKTDNKLLPDVVSATPLTANTNLAAATSGIRAESASQPQDQKEIEIKLKFGEETHQYVRDYIRQADQKAAFVFAGSTALIAYLNSLGFTSIWLTTPKSWGINHALACIATLGLVIGCIFCASTIMPRLGGNKRGFIFFNAIREYESSAEYSEDILSRELSHLCEAKFKHIYELSAVCKDKYTSVTYAFRFGIAGVFSTFALLALR